MPTSRPTTSWWKWPRPYWARTGWPSTCRRPTAAASSGCCC